MDFNLVFKNKHLEKLHQDNNFFPMTEMRILQGKHLFPHELL